METMAARVCLRGGPCIIGLGSGNGPYLNNPRIESQRYELRDGRVRVGFSSRECVALDGCCGIEQAPEVMVVN